MHDIKQSKSELFKLTLGQRRSNFCTYVDACSELVKFITDNYVFLLHTGCSISMIEPWKRECKRSYMTSMQWS